MSSVVDEVFKHKMIEAGYISVQKIQHGDLKGTWVGLYRFMFTWGLIVGLSAHGYGYRYCYDSLTDAQGALNDMVKGERPTGYIKRKG